MKKATAAYSTLHDICHDYIHCRSVINPFEEEKELIMLCEFLGVSLEKLLEVYKLSFEINSGESLRHNACDFDYYFQEMLKNDIGKMTAQKEMRIQKFANGDIKCC